MSKNGVYPSSAPSFLSREIKFEAAHSLYSFGGRGVPFVALGSFVVLSKWSKIGLHDLRVLPEFRD